MHILQMKLNGNQMKYFWIILNSTEHANLEKLICQKTPSGCSIDSGYQHTWHAPTQGFPSEINCWGNFWRKQLKTSRNEQNQHFGGKTVFVCVFVCVCVCVFVCVCGKAYGNIGRLTKVLAGGEWVEQIPP